MHDLRSAFIMRGFMETGLRNRPDVGVEFIGKAIEVIEWGRQVWRSVKKEDRGVIFERTFLRGVQSLHLEVFMKVCICLPCSTRRTSPSDHDAAPPRRPTCSTLAWTRSTRWRSCCSTPRTSWRASTSRRSSKTSTRASSSASSSIPRRGHWRKWCERLRTSCARSRLPTA